jgi:hypothetical protein
MGMLCYQCHDAIAPKFRDSRRRGVDDHPIGNGYAARTVQPLLPLDLYHAELTSLVELLRHRIFYGLAVAINNMRRFLTVNRGDIGMKADMGYIDPSLFSCQQYGCAFSNANLCVIDLYFRHDADLLTWGCRKRKNSSSTFQLSGNIPSQFTRQSFFCI